MDTLVLNIERIRLVLTMFRITQGELARASGVSTAMVSLLLAEKNRPSMRTAIALIHGLEKLLTRNRRLDTSYFIVDLSPSNAAGPKP